MNSPIAARLFTRHGPRRSGRVPPSQHAFGRALPRADIGGTGRRRDPAHVAALCHSRWTDLADAIASLPEPVEVVSAIVAPRVPGCVARAGANSPNAPERILAFLAIGRGESPEEAEGHCLRNAATLRTLVATILDYVELEPIADEAVLGTVPRALERAAAIELRRRRERLQVSHGIVVAPVGFERDEDGADRTGSGRYMAQVVPWVPSDDTWRRLSGRKPFDGSRS